MGDIVRGTLAIIIGVGLICFPFHQICHLEVIYLDKPFKWIFNEYPVAILINVVTIIIGCILISLLLEDKK